MFTDSLGRPLSQEWLHKRVWKPALRTVGLAERGMNAVRDTFITTAIDEGHSPSWIAEVCDKTVATALRRRAEQHDG